MSVTVRVESTIAYGEVGVVCSECRDGDDASRGEVMTMTPACGLVRPSLEWCAWGFLCVPLSGCEGFSPVLHN